LQWDEIHLFYLSVSSTSLFIAAMRCAFKASNLNNTSGRLLDERDGINPNLDPLSRLEIDCKFWRAKKNQELGVIASPSVLLFLRFPPDMVSQISGQSGGAP
jgi:hypothetical protein